MDTQDLLTIGEMAKLCQVSIKTLRYYDKTGLLVPVYVHPVSLYRYYSPEQIGAMGIILSLKNSGFELPKIREILKENNFDIIIEAYENKRDELEREIEKLSWLKERFEDRLSYFKKAKSIRNTPIIDDVILKEIPVRKVAFIRERSPVDMKHISSRFIKILKWSQKYEFNLQGHMLIFYEKYNNLNPLESDYETSIGMDSRHEAKYPFVRNIEAGSYVSKTYRGAWPNSIPCYLQIIEWIHENDYQVCGPVMVIPWISYMHSHSQDEIVAEMQILVKKITK